MIRMYCGIFWLVYKNLFCLSSIFNRCRYKHAYTVKSTDEQNEHWLFKIETYSHSCESGEYSGEKESM